VSDEPDRETHKDRIDRELNELLGELRVALPECKCYARSPHEAAVAMMLRDI
jgi:hypothetical protein